MNDLLSELDSITGGEPPSRTQRSGSSSPLRPNPKYCAPPPTHAQSQAHQQARRRSGDWSLRENAPGPSHYPSPIFGGTSSNMRDRFLSPVGPDGMGLPGTVQHIMSAFGIKSLKPEPENVKAETIDDDMETDAPRPSSPIRPNEKYCPIVPRSKQRIAVVQPLRTARPRSLADYGTPQLHRKPEEEWNAKRETEERTIRQRAESEKERVRRMRADEERRLKKVHEENKRRDELARKEKIRKAADEANRWKEKAMQEQDRVRKEIQRRANEDAKRLKIIQEQWKRQQEEQMRKAIGKRPEEARKTQATIALMVGEARRVVEERLILRRQQAGQAVAMGYCEPSSIPLPPPPEDTISMTREQLERLKAECIAAGEQRAQAVARLSQTLDRIDENAEAEPMDVEESDVIESSVPRSSAHVPIAPKPLLVKEEPVEAAPQQPATEVPAIADTIGHKKEKEKEKETEKEQEKEKDKNEDDAIAIIEPPSPDVVTISDDEDTVPEAGKSGADTVSVKKEIQREPANVDDDLWIIGSRRIAKKDHVFDPSKVKQEKEESVGKVPEASAPAAPVLPFIASKVKTEPAGKEAAAAVVAAPAASAAVTAGRKTLEARKTKRDSRWDVRVKAEPGETVEFSPLPPPGLVKPSLSHEELTKQKEHQGQANGEQQQPELVDALAAARRLIKQIGEVVDASREQPPRVFLPRSVHHPAPDTFLHALRTARRKRRGCCDADEDLEHYERTEESEERHEWGAKRGRWDEDEEERSGIREEDEAPIRWEKFVEKARNKWSGFKFFL